MAETIEGGADARGTLEFLRRVSDRRRRIATFAPGHWQTERRRSQDIVVSARGWLVVNPVRSHYAYGWVETSTPLSSCFHC
jgi:hypothetical protein